MARASGVTATPVIERNSVADQVYAELRGRILSGALEQGSRVVEAQVAKELGVSRAPVREAVNRLVEAGLLEGRTHFGNTVVTMTPEKVRHLYAVRVAVETLAVRELLARGPGGSLKLLRDRMKDMKAHAKAGDLAGLVEAELSFHEALWTMADNPYVSLVAGLLSDHVRLALAVDNAAYSDMAEVAREHEPVLEAIESGDPDRAAEALRTHILASLGSLIDGRAAATRIA